MTKSSARRLAGCIAFAAVLALLFASPFGQRLERESGLSALYSLRGKVPVPPEAIIVSLDQATIDWLQFNAPDLAEVAPALGECVSPETRRELASLRNVGDMPREVHACLIRQLTARGARLIVFDILFSVTRDVDPILASAIADAGNVVLFEGIRVVDDPALDIAKGGVLRQAVHPRRLFTREAAAVGFFLVGSPFGDFVDGYVTRLDEYPELVNIPRAVWQLYTGQRPEPEPPGTRRLQPIWLYGPPKAIPTHSIREVFDADSANPLPDRLDDVVVFVGVSDPDDLAAEDHFKTPISDRRDNNVAGVELATSAFLNTLHDEKLRPLPPAISGLLVLGFGLAIGLAAGFLRGVRGLWWIALTTAVYLGLAWWAFTQPKVWLPFAVPLYLGVTGAVLLALATRYALARALVGNLAPHQVAASLLDEERGRGGVRTETATVLFTDLVDSTGLGETLPISDYAELMSRYYEHATREVEAKGGMVIEFMGDGILAVFSETVCGPDHAAAACNVAIALARSMRNADAPSGNGRERLIRLRMGLDTGPVATGRIGAAHRFNYKVLGDTVNTAARLEQLGKQMDAADRDTILVSAATMAASRLPPTAFDDLGSFVIRGKRAKMRVLRLDVRLGARPASA